jgi:hypothetical protein
MSFKDFKKGNKKAEKELNEWRQEILRKHNAFEIENKCRFVPMAYQMNDFLNSVNLQLGFGVLTEKEFKERFQSEEKPKEETKK